MQSNSNFFDNNNYKVIKIFNRSCAFNGCNRKGKYYLKIIFIKKSGYFCHAHYVDLELNGLIDMESSLQTSMSINLQKRISLRSDN